jgi:hypothetical protein
VHCDECQYLTLFHFCILVPNLLLNPLCNEHPLLHVALHGNGIHSTKNCYSHIQTLFHVVDLYFLTRSPTQSCLHIKCIYPHLMVIFKCNYHMFSNKHALFLLFPHLWPPKEKQLPLLTESSIGRGGGGVELSYACKDPNHSASQI